ncbi:hypothetical protein AYO21_11711 [Fonsecaea monophora]|uniref:Uncharacterized protein n=1 Tax=Fonsecaea monophora TaxID=254056 RepID=A0A177ERP8_9EURO|nr:hypothetical protein AYO21_11711 [Fonsecaea monophora]KAH0829847.1 hypothetical protein FOPE_10396 [Fonsecaea pedrosoi]OAG34131.1 hypothetical protein AYO21_11711 [Fonsecaea monophora]
MRLPPPGVSRSSRPPPPPQSTPAVTYNMPAIPAHRLSSVTAHNMSTITGREPDLEEQVRELKRQLDHMNETFAPLVLSTRNLRDRVMVQEQLANMNRSTLMVSLAISRRAAATEEQLRREQQQFRNQLGALPPPHSPIQIREPRLAHQGDPAPDLPPPAVWLPPGPPPRLCYPGRAVAQSDLVMVHVWYLRLGHGAVLGRYNAQDYRRDMLGRNRIEIRDSMPFGFLQGWVLSHTDEVFGHFIPEVAQPGWPLQLKIHNNPGQGIFIAAVVHDNRGLRPCHDSDILELFQPTEVVDLLDMLLLFWETADMVYKSRDLGISADEMIEYRVRLDQLWEDTSATISRALDAYPWRQKVLDEVRVHQGAISQTVVGTIIAVDADRAWKRMLGLLMQARPTIVKAEYVLRGIISHESSRGESLNTDLVEMFSNPFVEELLGDNGDAVTDNSEPPMEMEAEDEYE